MNRPGMLDLPAPGTSDRPCDHAQPAGGREEHDIEEPVGHRRVGRRIQEAGVLTAVRHHQTARRLIRDDRRAIHRDPKPPSRPPHHLPENRWDV